MIFMFPRVMRKKPTPHFMGRRLFPYKNIFRNMHRI